MTFLYFRRMYAECLYIAGNRHANFEPSSNSPRLILIDDLEPVLTSFKIIKTDENA